MDNFPILSAVVVLLLIMAIYVVLLKATMEIMNEAVKMVTGNLDYYSSIYGDVDVVAISFRIVRVNLWKKNRRVSIHRINSSFCYYPSKISKLFMWNPALRNLDTILYDALMDLYKAHERTYLRDIVDIDKY